MPTCVVDGSRADHLATGEMRQIRPNRSPSRRAGNGVAKATRSVEENLLPVLFEFIRRRLSGLILGAQPALKMFRGVHDNFKAHVRVLQSAKLRALA